ncbi:MAG: hypothetical protein HYZ28_14640 [Myxococcales bacterium]|nr:hypothetical protein [Myxococcales bacterium]
MRRRLKRWGIAAGLLLVLQPFRVAGCAGASRSDSEVRLAYLARRIDEGTIPGLAPGHPFDGEWRLVALSMSVVAAANLAHRHPETRRERGEQVDRWAERMMAADVRAYDARQWGSDPLETLDRPDGHAGYLGHVALALDARCILGGKVDPLHARVVDALARRIDRSPSALIETYPGETYLPDNVVAVAGIAAFDDCTGRREHAATVERYLQVMRERWLDPESGLLVFAPGQLARGSGAAWNAFYLPFIDEDFARDQAQRAWRTFGVELPGGVLAGILEHPRGSSLGGDVDSGPLVFGVSPSATGFMLAAAVRGGDSARLLGLLRTAELVGFSFGWEERRYLAGPLVGDAIVLAAKTATPWQVRAEVRASRPR